MSIFMSLLSLFLLGLGIAKAIKSIRLNRWDLCDATSIQVTRSGPLKHFVSIRYSYVHNGKTLLGTWKGNKYSPLADGQAGDKFSLWADPANPLSVHVRSGSESPMPWLVAGAIVFFAATALPLSQNETPGEGKPHGPERTAN